MKVYGSLTAPSYSSEYPGERREFPSCAMAHDWFTRFINNGHSPYMPHFDSTAELTLYGSQESEDIIVRYSQSVRRNGYYTVKKENG